MNERLTDFELMRDFVRRSDQEAFGALVRRHLDLVYATALRKVTDSGAAEEIAQNVFSALARKAWQFASDDSLPAWLHKTALLESKQWLRGELRRRRREETAVALGTTMKAPDEPAVIRDLLPMLDEALLSVGEKDRTALLLRYYGSQTFRELAGALGVGEDAAQKRVARALDELSHFFQRRGFKTATLAAITAALQHTAASASAATATVVIQGALQAAPPALVGLALLCSRLASLSQPQLAVLCLAMGALPVAWQWHEYRAAADEAAQIQAHVGSVRRAQTALETEMQGLTGTAQQLLASIAKGAEIEEEDARKRQTLESWLTRVRSALTADDYHWPDDSPFVRIPKTAVPELSLDMPVHHPGVIKSEARELLGLSPQERAAAEEHLRTYFAELDHLSDVVTYETNRSSRVRPPASAVASTIFCLPPLGDAVKASSDHFATEMRAVLGEERWAWVESGLNSYGTHTLRRVLNLDADQESQEVGVWIKPNSEGVLTVGYQWASTGSSFSSDGASLASVLSPAAPEGGRSAIEDVRRNNLPNALAARVIAWLQGQAEARLSKGIAP